MEFGRTRKNSIKWVLSEDYKCTCERVQEDKHNTYECLDLKGTCNKVDEINDSAIKLTIYWTDKV